MARGARSSASSSKTSVAACVAIASVSYASGVILAAVSDSTSPRTRAFRQWLAEQRRRLRGERVIQAGDDLEDWFLGLS